MSPRSARRLGPPSCSVSPTPTPRAATDGDCGTVLYQGRGPLTKATRTPARTPPHRRRWVCYPRLVYWGYAINMTCVTWGSGCSRSPPCPYRGTGTPLPPAGGEASWMAVQLRRGRRGGGGRCVCVTCRGRSVGAVFGALNTCIET